MNINLKLSPYHKIFYNEWKLDPVSSKYNIVFDQTLDFNLDIEKFKRALHSFISDHLLLNSHIEEYDEQLYWKLNSNVSIDYFNKFDNNIISKYVIEPFNLKDGPLYRFALFHSNNNFRFISVLHHILIDANCFDEFIEEISCYYNDNNYHCKFNLQEQESKINLTVQKFNQHLQINHEQNKNFWKKLSLMLSL
jgi:NRPS condensation-like uncharacterized protein